MTFAETATTIEGETSSHVTEMIEELTQLEGAEVPKISEEVPASTTAVIGESFQPGDSPEDLLSLTPQLGKI